MNEREAIKLNRSCRIVAVPRTLARVTELHGEDCSRQTAIGEAAHNAPGRQHRAMRPGSEESAIEAGQAIAKIAVRAVMPRCNSNLPQWWPDWEEVCSNHVQGPDPSSAS